MSAHVELRGVCQGSIKLPGYGVACSYSMYPCSKADCMRPFFPVFFPGQCIAFPNAEYVLGFAQLMAETD